MAIVTKYLKNHQLTKYGVHLIKSVLPPAQAGGFLMVKSIYLIRLFPVIIYLSSSKYTGDDSEKVV